MSDYVLKHLYGEDLERYLKKIRLINDIDPYTIPSNVFSNEKNPLPDIEIIDIVSYFVFTHSFFSKVEFKNYKTLESFRWVESGFVKKVRHTKINEYYVVVSEVKHSQRMNEKPLDVWIMLQSDGSIKNAHCTCMAGLDETCSHIGATVFYIHLKNSETQSCTDRLSLWPVPKPIGKIEFKRIKDIDWGTRIKSYATTRNIDVQPLEGIELNKFLQKLYDLTPESAILKVSEGFADKYVKIINKNLPTTLKDIYNPELDNCSLEEVREVKINLTLTEEQQAAIFDETLDQANNDLWFEMKAGRITASQFKKACRTKLESPSLSLIKSLCYPCKVNFKIPALQYGINHEETAIKTYFEDMKKKHVEFDVLKSGLVVSMSKPFLAASPDGIIVCKCCGTGCLEVKCPFRLKDMNIEEFSKLADSYLIKNSDGSYSLDREHSYYYQIQLQMFCLGVSFCDFVVWSKKEQFVVDRVYLDPGFLEENIKIAENFHENVIIPELLSRCYTVDKAPCHEITMDYTEENNVDQTDEPMNGEFEHLNDYDDVYFSDNFYD